MMIRIELNGDVRFAKQEDMWSVADELVGKWGGGVPAFTRVETPAPVRAPAPVIVETIVPTERAFSEFGSGKQIIDAEAKGRIEGTHLALIQAGVAVNAGEQLFATGTRMAEEGYRTQTTRKAEHEKKMLAGDAAEALRRAVEAEEREDVVVTARSLADSLEQQREGGTGILADGYALTEQAMRGLLARIESPALSYLLGMRKRIALGQTDVAEERKQMLLVLDHELRMDPKVELKLRRRGAMKDVFAIVSPTYAVADAPVVMDQILGQLPESAKGTWSYDPTTTTWELRASVWTPTPVDEQAVGEPFEGYVSFQARDNGTASFRGGGGVMLIACLNASTYMANSSDVCRVHRGRVLYDIEAMLKGSVSAIGALCRIWGEAREETIENEHLIGLPVSQAIPGIWWGELLDRKSELAGVLRGRTVDHVKGLTDAYFDQRRDPSRLVRADLAQGWTRYVQDQPADVRRLSEAAIGDWLASRRPVRFEERKTP